MIKAIVLDDGHHERTVVYTQEMYNMFFYWQQML